MLTALLLLLPTLLVLPLLLLPRTMVLLLAHEGINRADAAARLCLARRSVRGAVPLLASTSLLLLLLLLPLAPAALLALLALHRRVHWPRRPRLRARARLARRPARLRLAGVGGGRALCRRAALLLLLLTAPTAAASPPPRRRRSGRRRVKRKLVARPHAAACITAATASPATLAILTAPPADTLRVRPLLPLPATAAAPLRAKS